MRRFFQALLYGQLFLSCALFSADSTAPLVYPNNILLEIEFSRFEGDKFWSKGGKSLQAHNTLRRHLAEMTLEKGLSSQDNLIAYINYTDIHERIHQSENTFGDAEIAYKRKILGRENSILSAELRAIIPTGGYIPELRYGCFGLQAALLYGRTFFIMGKKITLDTELAYRGYFSFPSDQLRGHLYAFYDCNSRFQLKAALDGTFGFYNGKEPREKSFFFYNANFRVLTGEISLKAFISDKATLWGGVWAPLIGANYGQGVSILCGADFCFR